MPMVADWDAETAVRMGFYANVIVYRCVQIVANTIASRPFRAGRTPPKKVTEVGDPDPSCRLAQLLGPPPGGPAPRLSARRLWAWSIAQRIVTGKHAWEIETAGRSADGEVAALWPLVSSQTRPIPSEGGVDWFSAFDYGPAHKPRRLRPDQILYGWNPSATDFRQPESALQAARLDVSIAVMQDRYNVAFLRNDARPAAVVVTEEFADDEEYEAFKGQFRGEYGGPDNAGKTAFVEAKGSGDQGVTGAIDIKVLGLSQRDAQFIQQHKASLERVAMALGVPWSKLDASGRTFDNASEEDHSWWESELMPKMMDLQDEVNMQLAPRLGREVGWFDLSDVRALQAPKNVQAVGAPSLVSGGVATVDEARAMVGLLPLPDGKGQTLVDVVGIAMAALAAQMAPVAEDEATVEPPPAPIAVEPLEPVEPAAVAATAPEPERRDTPEDRAPTPEEQEARRARLWTTADAVVRGLERQWERRWTALFNRQVQATLDRLEGNRGRKAIRDPVPSVDPSAVFSRQFWEAESAEVAADLYEAVFAAGGARISDLFGIAFDLAAPYAQDFIAARANKLAGQVTDTTYDAIRRALADGVAEGEGIPDLARRIRHVFDVATTSRATTIARTEVVSAYAASSRLTADQLPDDVVGGYEWISTRDGRTREDHANADGQVIGRGQAFDVGGEMLAYPGDPNASPDNTVNCRCALATLTPEEVEAALGARSRWITPAIATVAISMVSPGHFDEARFRQVLESAAA
jgi:HK97 family phage portal protein